jgi:hypothetical protein
MTEKEFWQEHNAWLEIFENYKEPEIIFPRASEFPEAYPEGKKMVPTLLKERRKELKQLEKDKSQILQWAVKHQRDPQLIEATAEVMQALCLKNKESKLKDDIKRLSLLNRYYNPPKTKGGNTTIDKEDVKDIPITDFVEFNRANKAKCLWHDDNNPSMQYYPKTNTVYCWSCGHHGDVISVVQSLHNCTFQEALKILKK